MSRCPSLKMYPRETSSLFLFPPPLVPVTPVTNSHHEFLRFQYSQTKWAVTYGKAKMDIFHNSYGIKYFFPTWGPMPFQRVTREHSSLLSQRCFYKVSSLHMGLPSLPASGLVCSTNACNFPSLTSNADTYQKQYGLQSGIWWNIGKNAYRV